MNNLLKKVHGKIIMPFLKLKILKLNNDEIAFLEIIYLFIL